MQINKKMKEAKMKIKIALLTVLMAFWASVGFAYTPTQQEFMRDMREAYDRWIAPNFRNNGSSMAQDDLLAAAGGAASGRSMDVGDPVPEDLALAAAGGAVSGRGAARNLQIEDDEKFAAAMAAVEEEAMILAQRRGAGAASASSLAISGDFFEEVRMQYEALDPLINVIKTAFPEHWTLGEALEQLEVKNGKDCKEVVILREIPKTLVNKLIHLDGKTLDGVEQEVAMQAVLASEIGGIYRQWKALLDMADYPSMDAEAFGQ